MNTIVPFEMIWSLATARIASGEYDDLQGALERATLDVGRFMVRVDGSSTPLVGRDGDEVFLAVPTGTKERRFGDWGLSQR